MVVSFAFVEVFICVGNLLFISLASLLFRFVTYCDLLCQILVCLVLGIAAEAVILDLLLLSMTHTLCVAIVEGKFAHLNLNVMNAKTGIRVNGKFWKHI